MAQLGKYDSDRDNILHYLCTCDWANDSFGDVEAPTGYVWRITNRPADVHIPNTEVTSLIEDQLAAYDIEDSPEFRSSLVGNFLVWEDSNGLVSVLKFPTEADLLSVYSTLQDEFYAWDSQDDD
jgi:hypothetical protein